MTVTIWKSRRRTPAFAAAALFGLACSEATAQADPIHSVDALPAAYRVVPNVVYRTASGQALTLDAYIATAPGLHPTVLYFHGGGWVGGDKAETLPALAPWLARGWNVINVRYRLGSVAPAPAAVEDARCALWWTVLNAEDFSIDRDRIVTAGASAGGHLALMAAMLPAGHPLDNACQHGVSAPAALTPRRLATGAVLGWAGPPPRVKAVVNLFGVSDVTELSSGPQPRTFALSWLGERAGDPAVTDALSPLSHVRANGPAVFTVHGDSDPYVPVSQSRRLHAALEAAGTPETIEVIEGGGHGGFSGDTWAGVYPRLFAWLSDLDAEDDR